MAVQMSPKSEDGKVFLSKDVLSSAMQKTHLLYDKNGEEHFNVISALHKSLRGSDVDASLYWLGRLIEAGEGSFPLS